MHTIACGLNLIVIIDFVKKVPAEDRSVLSAQLERK